MNVRDQDRLGLYVAIVFVAFACAICLSALLKAPSAPRANAALVAGARR